MSESYNNDVYFINLTEAGNALTFHFTSKIWFGVLSIKFILKIRIKIIEF